MRWQPGCKCDLAQRTALCATHLTTRMMLCAKCRAGLWAEAHQARESLLGYLTAASGVGTLLDTRRARDYDPDLAVDRYLNQPAVQARPHRTDWVEV